MAQQTERLATVGEAPIDDAAERRAADALRRAELRSTPGFYKRSWRRFRRNRISMVALMVVGLVVVFVLSAGLISEFVTHKTYSENSLANKLAAPGEDGYILGADANGRDILTRLAYGGRVSLLVAILAAVSTLAIGGAVGSISGYFGGLMDTILMRLVDVVISIPALSLLILISVLFKPGYVLLAVVIAVVSWTTVARLIRGEVLSLRRREYIEAARVVGASDSRIIARHIFPNVVPLVIVWASLVVPGLILTEATLSFLGLGVRIPTPSWGNMLQDARASFRQSWTNVFFPGFMIYITVLAINLVGNGLRDALDPRLND
jgi:ABC-type dipeptide/oligopeptide/nickel transport system permease subunit